MKFTGERGLRLLANIILIAESAARASSRPISCDDGVSVIATISLGPAGYFGLMVAGCSGLLIVNWENIQYAAGYWHRRKLRRKAQNAEGYCRWWFNG